MIVNSQINNSLVAGLMQWQADASAYSFTSEIVHHEMRVMNNTDGKISMTKIFSNENSPAASTRKRITTMYNGKAYHPLNVRMLGRDTCCNVSFQGFSRSVSGDAHSGSAFIDSHTGLTLGGSDFTIECTTTPWTGQDMATEWTAVFCWLKGQSYDNGAGELIGFETGTTANSLGIYWAGGTGTCSKVTVTDLQTTEHHFEADYVHSTGKLYFFVDGALVLTKTKTLTAQARCFGVHYFAGSCKYFRVSKIARHTAAFTKPTSLSKDSNTSVFLQYPISHETGRKTTGWPMQYFSFASTTAQSIISNINSSESASFYPIKYDLETPYNTSNTSTSYGSIYSKGHQYVEIYNVPLGYTDFTIEFWIKPDSGNITSGTNVARMLKIQCNGQDDNNFAATIVFNGWKINSPACSLKSWSSSNLTQITGTTAISAGTWYHVAFVYEKSNGKQSLYVNGTLQGSRTYTIPPQGYNLTFPGDNMGRFQGKFSDLVISSTARWTAAFTKPTATPSTSTTVGNLGRYFYSY